MVILVMSIIGNNCYCMGNTSSTTKPRVYTEDDLSKAITYSHEIIQNPHAYTQDLWKFDCSMQYQAFTYDYSKYYRK